MSPWLERQFDEAAAPAELSLNLPMAGFRKSDSQIQCPLLGDERIRREHR
jgi:hypothetical protein